MIDVKSAGIAVIASCIAPAAIAATFSIVGSVPARIDGSEPQSNLVASGGLFYGTTPVGGAAGDGTIYSVNPTTGLTKILYSFGGAADGSTPQAALTDVAGVLYGTTTSGGAQGGGTLFAYNPATKTETPLYAFVPGASPGPLLDISGVLYGTTATGGGANAGTLFSFDPVGNSFQTVYAFSQQDDLATPCGPLTYADGRIYGCAEHEGKYDEGGVFSFNPATSVEKTIYNFNEGLGNLPSGALTYAGGMLYGYDAFYLYKLNPQTGQFTLISDLNALSPIGPLLRIGSVLYGTLPNGGTAQAGAIYALDTATDILTTVYSFTGSNDGGTVNAGLINRGNVLYGVASSGGAGGKGTVFAVDSGTGAETTLYAFRPAQPYYTSSLLRVGGYLYGTVAFGGDLGQGAVIKVNLGSKAVTTVYSFTGGTDGGQPEAELIDIGGKLYGTTSVGGAAGLGTIFSFDPAAETESVLYSFQGGTADGSTPAAALLYQGGLIYGTTNSGGAFAEGSDDGGTLFQFNPATGTETILDSFQSVNPGISALINVDNVLFGTVRSGGTHGSGLLFGFDPTSASITQSYDFSAPKNGLFPGTLLNVGGALWGTAQEGGQFGGGTIFNYAPGTGTYSKVYSFSAAKPVGAFPGPAFVQSGNQLYSTTVGTGAGQGTLYRVGLGTGAAWGVHDFTGGNGGGNPASPLVVVGHSLYGTTSAGGAYGVGVVYEYKP